MLNAHGVAVSVVNNDVSTSLVYSVCCYSVSARSQVVVKDDHMCVYMVGLDTMYRLWCHVCNKFLYIENHP